MSDCFEKEYNLRQHFDFKFNFLLTFSLCFDNPVGNWVGNGIEFFLLIKIFYHKICSIFFSLFIEIKNCKESKKKTNINKNIKKKSRCTRVTRASLSYLWPKRTLIVCRSNWRINGSGKNKMGQNSGYQEKTSIGFSISVLASQLQNISQDANEHWAIQNRKKKKNGNRNEFSCWSSCTLFSENFHNFTIIFNWLCKWVLKAI